MKWRSHSFWILAVIIVIASLLRLVRLDQNPPSLYWDEVSLGYNAFSILKSGIDEHGEKYPLARFIAFGDYKPPGYIYSIVPFMAVLGPSEWAVRLPSALSGIALVVVTFFLARHLFKNDQTALVAAGLLAISPWGIQLSRAAFESHLATLFNALAVLCFIFFPKGKKWLLPLSFIFFILAFYTFNANRIISPLMLLLLCGLYFKEVWQSKKWLIISIILSIVLVAPSIGYLMTRESRLRFQEVSIFTSLKTVEKSNERIARSGNTWWAKLLYNRRLYFAADFLKHYSDQFKGSFLFISGDQNPRLSIQDVGELYLFELPFLLIGLYQLLKRHDKQSVLVLGWMLIAPIPAATARETPHMLRAASLLPTFQILGALGFSTFFTILQQKKKAIRFAALSLILICVSFSVFYYQYNYWRDYPRNWSQEWQYGYKELVAKVHALEGAYDRISITNNYGRPYIYFLFYNQILPQEYLQTRVAQRDWYGLWTVDGFGKYDFTERPPGMGEKVLQVSAPGNLPKENVIEKIYRKDGQVVFEIGTL